MQAASPKIFQKNLTKNATIGIINASSSLKTQNYTIFAAGRANFKTARNFFEEKLDIILLMWYTINYYKSN